VGGSSGIDGAISRVVFPGVVFGRDDLASHARLARAGAGGFCLYRGPSRQIIRAVASFSKAAGRPLFFCADYEEGVWSHCPDATPLPSNMGIAASGSERLAYLKGLLTAREAQALGVSWVLAPVVDLASRSDNPIINTRSFGADPGNVVRLAGAYMRGLRRGGVMSCLKHFPGHGSAASDSHLVLPRLRAGARELWRRDLLPFKLLSAHADAVMAAHVLAPGLSEPKTPVSLSPALGDILRDRWGFQGLILTDAIHMKAVSGHFGEFEAACRALAAGADVLLVPQDPGALMARLAAEVRRTPALDACSRRAVRLLDAVARRRLPPKAPTLEILEKTREIILGRRSHRLEADRMARLCLAWKPRTPRPKIGREVAYLESGTLGRQPEGEAFIGALRSMGIRVVPWRRGMRLPVVLGSFMRPRARSGLIHYGRDSLFSLRKVLREAPASLVVSFGSPFVLADLPGAGLCAFSAHAPSQRAAAEAVAGKISVSGKMPVSL
jgi:beta-glucosidase